MPFDFFRPRIDAMINLNHPLAVLARRMPWAQIEAALAPMFERRDRPGEVIEGQDLVGRRTVVVGTGRRNAGRPKLVVRLMASLVYLKHSFNLSDEELPQSLTDCHALIRAQAELLSALQAQVHVLQPRVKLNWRHSPKPPSLDGSAAGKRAQRRASQRKRGATRPPRRVCRHSPWPARLRAEAPAHGETANHRCSRSRR
jgi:hypothetical protein